MATRSSSAAVNDLIEIDPARIRFRISPIADLHGVVGGDWDIERRHILAKTVKYQAIRDHLMDGVPWEETELFTDIYRRRLKTGHVRGETTFEGLVRQYNTRVDGMAESLRREGFKLTWPSGKPYPLPGFYIGRDGDVFIGNQGNHRLAMAQVLGLDRIIGRVVCRHELVR
jgi:hypothetical protein